MINPDHTIQPQNSQNSQKMARPWQKVATTVGKPERVFDGEGYMQSLLPKTQPLNHTSYANANMIERYYILTKLFISASDINPNRIGVDNIRGKLTSFMICFVLISSMVVSIDTEIGSSSVNEYFSTRSSRSMPSDNWSEAIPLSVIDDNDASSLEFEVYKNNVHVVWEENYNIFYRRSEDNGETWSDIIALVSNQEYNATTPDLAVDGNDVYIVWVDETIVPDDSGLGTEDIYGTIYYKTSNDNGQSWNEDFKVVGDHSFMPSITVKNSKIHLVWTENDYEINSADPIYTYYNFQLHYIKFENGNWKNSILINKSSEWFLLNPGSDFTENPQIIVDNNNNPHIIWYDLTENYNRCIKYINSLNGGDQWNKIMFISQKNLTAHDPCIGIYNSDLFVFYNDDYGIRFNHSSNSGATWNMGQTIGDGFDTDFDINNLNIYLVNSNWTTTWDSELYLRTSSNNGKTWKNIIQITNNDSLRVFTPKIKVKNGYIHLIWLEGRSFGRELYYSRYLKKILIKITEINNSTVLVNQKYEEKLTCKNVDGEVTWNIESNASWLSLDQLNNSIFGTPTNKDVGTYWVNITASDSYGDVDEINITLTVLNTNDAPVIEGAPGNITVIQTEPIKLDLSFYIYDEDTPKADLSLQTSSKYIKTEGLELYLDYRNAGLMYENVTINVTDGELVSNNHYLEVEILLVDAWIVDIEDYSPKGNNVSVFSNITIIFNRLMNNTSCENAIKITPSINGKFNWDHNILTFHPATYLKYNTMYLVSIDTTETSIEGHPLNDNFSWSFTTEKMTSADSDNDGYPDEIDAFPANPDFYLDTDKDGMPDAWEDEYGLNKTDPSDALLDPDDDGKPNKDEFDDGTDPTISDVKEEDDYDYTSFIIINIIIILIIIILLIIKIKLNKRK